MPLAALRRSRFAAEPANGFDHALTRAVDFLLLGIAAQPKADRCLGKRVRDSQGRQHVAGFGLGGGARRARRADKSEEN